MILKAGCRTSSPPRCCFDDLLAVLTSASNPLTCVGASLHAGGPGELEAVRVQLPADSLFGSMVIDVRFAPTGTNLRAPTVVTHSEYLKNDFLAKGRFLTVLPSFMLKVPGWHPPLKALPVALPNTRAPIGIITLKNRMLNPACCSSSSRTSASSRSR